MLRYLLQPGGSVGTGIGPQLLGQVGHSSDGLLLQQGCAAGLRGTRKERQGSQRGQAQHQHGQQ